MVFLLAITQIGLLAFGLTSVAFVNIKAHQITEDICQSLRCSSLAYRCNRTLTSQYDSNSSSGTIRRSKKVPNSSDCKVALILTRGPCKIGLISERCNVSDVICATVLRRKNGMKIKFKLHCRRCSEKKPISITIRQNASGVIRTKACVYEKHCERRQDMVCTYKYSKEEIDQDQGLKPRLSDEKGKDRETTRYIKTIFCFVMLCLLLEILACVVLYIWMRNKHRQPATPEIENSFGIPSDDEPGQLSPNSPQSPGTNREIFQALPNNRAPRVIANNDDPSLELGRTDKNEEPLYWVLEGPDPSEEGPRSSGEPSSFSRIHQDPLRGVTEELPVQNKNTCMESLYGVVEIPIGVTERLYKEQEAGNTDDQPDSALSRSAAMCRFIMSLKPKAKPKPKAKVEA